MKPLLTKKNTLIFMSLITAFRALIAAKLELHPDEAYYWLWSRRLGPSYFDHSPMVAYFIKLTTLLSSSEFFVRLSCLLGSLAVSYLLWKLSKAMFREDSVAALSVIVFNVLPVTMSGSFIVTPDVPAFLFWSCAVYALWKVVQTSKPAWWYALGVLFGLALLSKYTSILLAPCVFLYLLVTGERKWLKTPHPYLAFLIGIILFTPVLYWNYAHDWTSFRFQFGHGMGGASYKLSGLIEYIGGQSLLVGPVVWFIGVYAAAVFTFRRTKAELFLSLTSLPVLLFFAYSSLKKSAGPNWAAFAYFSFSIIVARFLLEGVKPKKALAVAALGFSFFMTMLASLHTAYSVLPLEKMYKPWAKADATNFFYGYRALGAELRKDPDVKYAITPSHQLSAAISYYTDEKIYAYIDPKLARFSQFNFWKFPDELRDKEGVFVYVDGEDPGPFQESFQVADGMKQFTVKRKGRPIRTYDIVPGAGFKG
jgi:4-amino-4-deoxy-L-arabinose transferase-like glycosyltransferase